jgi:ribonuclease BN (tRNA processing enzyme)
MTASEQPLDVFFLGTGNSFAPGGRAFSSFLLNDHYLFDVGPTVLQQLGRAAISPNDIDLVLVSHFHADHYFGLPFLILDAWHRQRRRELLIAGPPGIEERTENLLETAFTGLSPKITSFKRRYFEVEDGLKTEIGGLKLRAAEVVHSPDLRCFAFQASVGGRTITYSGDSTLCDGLLSLVPGADALILECSCGNEPVHLSPEEVDEVLRHLSPGSRTVLTHLDGKLQPGDEKYVLQAQELTRYRL